MKTLKVIYNYNAAPEFSEKLRSLSDSGIEVSICPEANDKLLFQLLEEADVLWHCLRPVTSDLIQAAPRLKLIQKIGVGVNTIDLESAKKNSVAVCNMPGTNSRAVAEHTLGLMLATLRQTRRFDATLRLNQKSGWQWNSDRQDQLGEIHGKKIGLIGYGSVPRLLTPVLQAMGANVFYTATSKKPEALATYLPLDDLLRKCDIISLHLPLNNKTQNLISSDTLKQMKPGAILVNTARGGLIDETALYAALKRGELAGAGLDVFAEEPVPDGHIFFNLENVTLTPHIAWLTQETLLRSIEVAAENCHRLAMNKTLLHRII